MDAPSANTYRRNQPMQQQQETRVVSTTSTTRGGGTTETITQQSESNKELEALRARGFYRGPGMEGAASRASAGVVDEYVKEDAPVVEEKVHKRTVHEVLPQVHRERDVSEIKHAVLPIHDRVREERTYSERQLGEIREQELRVGASEEERRRNSAIASRLSHGYHQEMPTEHEYRYMRPEVEELERRHVVHVVHPVVQRQIEKEHYEREYLPIREHIVEGARVSDEVEVLRPLTRDEWEATHGRTMYGRSGWRHGREAEQYLEREHVLDEFEMPLGVGDRSRQYQYDDQPPSMRRRGSAPMLARGDPRGGYSRPIYGDDDVFDREYGRSSRDDLYDPLIAAPAADPGYIRPGLGQRTTGRIEETAGRAVGRPDWEVRGAERELYGRPGVTQRTVGRVEEGLGRATDRPDWETSGASRQVYGHRAPPLGYARAPVGGSGYGRGPTDAYGRPQVPSSYTSRYMQSPIGTDEGYPSHRTGDYASDYNHVAAKPPFFARHNPMTRRHGY
ncbi:hypothetical protein BC828DRAFT_416607 [Blastocladiella britannica]|nr:hypothetical protein BC828DRAFT_416607 [Blastocladiella britannica]